MAYDRGQIENDSTPIRKQMQDPVIVRKNFGDRVRSLRREKGWSQERLARESGLGRSFTGAIERGEKDLRIRTLCKLSIAFQKTLAELMQGIDDLSSIGKARTS